MSDNTLYVHSFESLAARDGEGLRYGIFLGGCPLRCAYCHNPDTWNMGATTAYDIDSIFAKIKRYRPYFVASGGGVTFSGGEPLLQATPLLSLVRRLLEVGISYTLDTSGAVPLTDEVKQLFLSASLVILDIKFSDAFGYTKYTGGDFSLVRQTLDFLTEHGVRLWVRTVIVPTVNDSEQALDGYIDFLRPYRDKILKYELLPFHTMGFFKYEKLGIENPFADKCALDPARLRDLQRYVDEHK